jgi:hypothetical protein
LTDKPRAQQSPPLSGFLLKLAGNIWKGAWQKLVYMLVFKALRGECQKLFVISASQIQERP